MTSDDFFWEKFVKNMIDLMIVKKREDVIKLVVEMCDTKNIVLFFH
jgi:hypothetical protein